MKSQSEILKEEVAIEKQEAGIRRNLTQIADTIVFDLQKNLRIFMIMFLAFLVIFILSFVIQELQYMQDVPLPDDPIDYMQSYLSFFGFMIMLSSAFLAGSIIAEDFQKQTSNLIFPKISKIRLFIGRTISRYTMSACIISFYYFLISLVTFMQYEETPVILWNSLGWALLYAFMLFSFVTFMSSFMKSTTLSIGISLVFLLIVFDILTSILMFSGSTEIEPLFSLTYYQNIISQCMDMPDPRYMEIVFNIPFNMEELGDLSIRFVNWFTPSEIGAFIGMVSFSIAFMSFAMIFYRRRQSKSI
ncbi:MAG: hypothetical protein JW891_14985 [Candidatus Lokiarchaeota archaeon]|nr:hypothetical protein [Candidatus Lokiarchaeota archaeon]